MASTLIPDFGQLTSTTLLTTLGQACCPLGLGGSLMVSYGSYMRRSQSIPGTAVFTALVDVSAALLAALIIVPAAMVLGVGLDSGPGLLLCVIPRIFAEMPLGSLFGALFFFSITLVTLLSLMAAYEVLIGAAADYFSWSRGRSLTAIAVLMTVLAVPRVPIKGSFQ